MALPTTKTPVPACLAAAAYTIQMIAKHPEEAALAGPGQRLGEGSAGLAQAERGVEDAEAALLRTRVDLKFEDHASDQFLRRLHHQAQSADGHKDGRIARTLFPDGLTEITRRLGSVQVKRMRDLEGRLEHLNGWPEAMTQLAGLMVRRSSYESAIEARTAGEQVVARARAARDAAKMQFLDTYSEVEAHIRAAFPRNRRMQELFFETVRYRRRGGDDEPDETLPGEPAGDDGDI